MSQDRSRRGSGERAATTPQTARRAAEEGVYTRSREAQERVEPSEDVSETAQRARHDADDRRWSMPKSW